MKVVSMMKWLVSSAVVLAFVAGLPARAQTIIGTEDAVDGFVGEVIIGPGLTPNPPIWFASDGEGFFHPFGYQQDATDGVQFDADAPWTSDMPAGTRWIQFDGIDQITGGANPNTWILPAVDENEPGFTEDVGRWFFGPGSSWLPGTVGLYGINAPDESLSDLIRLDDSGPGGSAAITFSSDPMVPEPGSLTLLGIGVVGMACYGWRRRKVAVQK